jgi:ABC-type uncharacterized transport system permease subunit
MRSRTHFIGSLICLLLGLLISLGITAVMGENPLLVLKVLVQGACGSVTDLGYSLFYATPLLFTGLSVAWAAKAGLFNVGAEGQMTMGGVTMVAVGILFKDAPPVLAWPLALTAAFVVGGAWGALAGWIKAYRGCHEVLSTIMLNFIAYGLAGFLILSPLKNPQAQVPETQMIGAGFRWPTLPAALAGDSPVNLALVLGLILTLIFGALMAYSRMGLRQRWLGQAPEVGRRAGLDMRKQTVLAMFISGGLAALAATSLVLGFAFKAREGFAANAGFIGIAVALLGRNSPVGIVLSALLFGMLSKGALDLDFDTQFVSRDLATIIQALIVLAVCSQAGFSSWLRRRA